MKLRWRVVLGAWLSLAAFVGLQWYTTRTFEPESWRIWERVSLYLLGVTVFGGFVTVALARDLDLTAAVVVVLSLLLTTHSSSMYVYEPSDALFALSLGVVLGSLETLAYSKETRHFWATREGIVATTVGVAHVCFGFVLLYLEHSWRLPRILSEYPLNLELLSYAALLLTVGTTVTALFLRRQAVSPLVLVVGWAGVAIWEAWQMYSAGDLPLFEPWGSPPSSLTPFPGYHWQVTSLVALVFFALAVEVLAKEALEKSTQNPTPTPE